MKVFVSILLAILVMALLFIIGAFFPDLLVIISLIVACGGLAAIIYVSLFGR
jgi:hypothetical protein